MEFKKYPERWLRHILPSPIIYSMIIILILFDLWTEMYHRICFWAYGIPYVKRSDYIRIDRHKLQYLNWFEKINCMYCGYANGLINYARIIAGETERYWCGIKHQPDAHFNEPEHHKNFLPYGDAEAYKNFNKKNNL